MASRGTPTKADPPDTRLYLVTPEVTDSSSLEAALAAALEGVDVAAVLLRLAAADERTLINRVKALAPVVQNLGIALLLDGHPEIAVRAGADGAHLTGIDAFHAALPTLKPARIAGCGGVWTRHDAMLAGEAGADYVMFGGPDHEGHSPSFDAVIERVTWWAEVFEIPCVGFAASPDEVTALAAAGADFVALGDWIFDDSRGITSAVADAARRVDHAETA